MNITEALQDDEYSTMRVSYMGRWLCRNDAGGWIVYSQMYRQKYARVVIDTMDEQKAVAALTADTPSQQKKDSL